MNYTYSNLELFLKEIISQLNSKGIKDSASLAEIALDFSCGLPSEFFGETRIYLIKILNNNKDLPIETKNKIELYIKLIDQGFQIANSGK